MTATLERVTFSIGRELEYFTVKELQMQIGHDVEWWPIALLKELIDNALDACEVAGVAPVIEVEVEPDLFSVRDNGPGMPGATLVGSLDYLKRVSDKAFYVSPTRGQMGNALKIVWAAPFVADGERGCVEVFTPGKHYTVEVTLDRIEQKPRLELAEELSQLVKNGTLVSVHWPKAASSLLPPPDSEAYNGSYDDDRPPTAAELVEGYSAFNPNATLSLGDTQFEATDRKWPKWLPGDATPAAWYTADTLRDLMAAYIADERHGGRRRTVREFISEFRGLSATAKQKTVTAGLTGVYLDDFIQSEDLDLARVERLLAAMQAHSRPPKPAALGILGETHIKTWMERYANVSRESIRYLKRMGVNRLPHVVEVAFGVRNADDTGRRILTGLNWSPTLGNPADELEQLIQEMRLDPIDPVTILVHLARPRFEFLDRGKTRLAL